MHVLPESGRAIDAFVRHFLSIDPRTLGLTRIALAALLLIDLARRASGIDFWYTDEGLLPRFAVEALGPPGWSFFWRLGDASAVRLAFAGCAVVYGALLVGFCTKAAQVASLLCVLSLQHRVQILTSGGDIVVCLLCWWTLFLPLGARFSVDALRRPRSVTPVVSVAVLGALLQLSVIYFFNAVHKDGATWRDGTALHYVLWLDRINTPIAAWARGVMPFEVMRLLTHATLVLEWVLPALILSPFGKPWTRRLAILLIVCLHAGISLFLNVGPFSLSMITFSTLLVSDRDWDALAPLARRLPWKLPSSSTLVAKSVLTDTRARRLSTLAREAAAAAFLFVVALQVLLENRSVPDLLRPKAPAFLPAFASAARLGESWGMFTPDVATLEAGVIVDAITVGGDHVDPYNEVAANRPDPRLRAVPVQAGYDVFFHHYTLRLPTTPALFPALSYWIFAHPHRSKNPNEAIRSFETYFVTRASPPPGKRIPPSSEARLLFADAR